MSVFFDISAALDDRLNGMAGLPAVAWPNREFNPTTGALYLRPTMILGDTVGGSSSGATIKDMYSGIYQVDIFAPSGQGKSEAAQMADAVADRFKRDTQLTYNGRTVSIGHSTQLPPRNDGAFYVVPVMIDFYALTTERA